MKNYNYFFYLLIIIHCINSIVYKIIYAFKIFLFIYFCCNPLKKKSKHHTHAGYTFTYFGLRTFWLSTVSIHSFKCGLWMEGPVNVIKYMRISEIVGSSKHGFKNQKEFQPWQRIIKEADYWFFVRSRSNQWLNQWYHN